MQISRWTLELQDVAMIDVPSLLVFPAQLLHKQCYLLPCDSGITNWKYMGNLPWMDYKK